MNALVKRRQAIIDADEIKRPRAISSFGNTGIPVAVCRKAGKKYSMSSGQKSNALTGRGGANLARFEREGTIGKMRGGLQWNNQDGIRQVWRD
jgi:hypothetical protein